MLLTHQIRAAFRIGLVVISGPLAVTCAAESGRIVIEEDFSQGAKRWRPTDEKAWRIIEEGDNAAYSLFQQSEYSPPHRSPFNIALLKGIQVGDFTLTARVRSTARDYPHRSMCMIFGYQDPAHFYYVHFGQQTDDHANQIFIVNDAPRTKISSRTTEGTPWDGEWHQVKIVRRTESGEIAVYFDDMEHPVMTANDRTFPSGRIGLGSFDDVGDWDDVRLEGELVPNRDGR